MSVVTLDAEISIVRIVETMLPRFSDRKLGLYFDIQLDLSDYGYGIDGDTLERESLSARSEVHILFVRPSNYTQVYVLRERRDDSKLLHPLSERYEWTQTSDHDSCWRELQPLADEYFALAALFKDREKGGKKIAPRDLSHFNCLNNDPTYVEINIQPVNPHAERYSKESRQFMIDLKPIARYRLEQIGYRVEQVSRMGNFLTDFTSGVLIKGSESHQNELKRKEYCDAKYGAIEDKQMILRIPYQ
jgi:hypothetical protein